MKEGGEEIAKVSLSNSTTPEFMTNLDPLIDFIFQHLERNDWHELINFYKHAIELLWKPTEFSDEEIKEFQSLVDHFYKK